MPTPEFYRNSQILKVSLRLLRSRIEFLDFANKSCLDLIIDTKTLIFLVFLVTSHYLESNNGIIVNSIYPGSHHSKISKEGEFTMTANEAAVSVVDHALLQHPCARPRGEFIWFDSKVSRHLDHFFKKFIFLSSDCGLGSRGSQGRNYDEKLSI